MNPLTIVACVALFAGAAYAGEGAFCYNAAVGCGPATSAWPEVCHEGQRQSPIDIPTGLKPTGRVNLRMLGAYKGDFFRIQNNGHSVSLDFVGPSGQNEGPSAGIFSFPDPLAVEESDQKIRDYKFASAHFHWGPSALTNGSEHCIGKKCSAMEIHLVHYLAKYDTMSDAVASNDESALTVLGVLIDVSTLGSLISRITSLGHPSLAPIVKNLKQVHHASHGGDPITINEKIDLTQLIKPSFLAPTQVYTYKGSLTTPGCNEQVNWFVVRQPSSIPMKDLEAFRTELQDSHGKTLNNNFRPLQELNQRTVYLSNVRATR